MELNKKIKYLDRQCLKIYKENAKAMINGFDKDGKKIRQSIYCLTNKKHFPKLITLCKNPPPSRFELSPTGKKLEADDYKIPYKYIVCQEGDPYFIKNDDKLWKKICDNGLFDIWNPTAPYKLFQESARPENNHIILLRVYEIEREINESDIEFHDINDYLKSHVMKVTIKEPIINDEKFKKIKELLEISVSEYLTRDPDINNHNKTIWNQ